MNEAEGVDVLAELNLLRQRVAELEQRVETPAPPEDRSTRRGMLRLAGAAVAGGAAASLAGAQPAAATTGAMQFGATNNADSDTTILNSSSLATFRANCTVDGSSGLVGTGVGNGNGVIGQITSPGSAAYGVFGTIGGLVGFALVGAGGHAQLWLQPFAVIGAPASGFHDVGEVVANLDGVFYCVADGTPGTWRKLAGSATAGAFHALTPTRVYDSRVGVPLPTGPLAAGGNRTVSVADGRNAAGAVTVPDLVPAGATAVMANVTVTGTVNGGFLAINPGGNLVAGASTINWFGSGQTIANGVTLTLNASRQVTVICGSGSAGSTGFIIDIVGYFL